MSPQKLAKIFGAVFVVIGIAGFIPGITMNGHLLGIFEVDPIHNVIHLLSGIVAFVMATGDMGARKFFRIFGIVYGLVTVLGFVNGASILGIFGVNMADNLLHLAITVIALMIGYGGKKSMPMASAPQSMNTGSQM